MSDATFTSNSASAEPSRPNVLLITLDQWRADCLSLAGHALVRTPNIDRLARRGTWFRNHYSQATPCSPARASLLTGLYQHNHRVVGNGTPLETRHLGLARAMRAAGYRPCLFGYTDTAVDPRDYPPGDPALETYQSVLPGFEPGVFLHDDILPWIAHLKSRGHAIPPDPADIWRPADPTAGLSGPTDAPPAYTAEDSETAFLTDAALSHLDTHDGGPWFLHVSLLRPHPPWIAPEPHNRLIDPVDVPPPLRQPDAETEGRQHPWLAWRIGRIAATNAMTRDPWTLGSLDARGTAQLRATYWGLIAEADAAVGRLLDRLDQRGETARTLVVLTSDHGEQLGEHFLWGKEGYFDSSFRVPLIICDPRAHADPARGKAIDAFTEAVDVMPTLLDLVDGTAPPCDGRSLRPLLAGAIPPDWREHVAFAFDFRNIRTLAAERAFGLPSNRCSLTAIRDHDFKYVHFAGLPPLLFDLREDPGEFRNLAGDAGYAAIVARYAQRLLSWRMAHEPHGLTHVHLGPGGMIGSP